MPPHSSSPLFIRRRTPSPILKKRKTRKRKRSALIVDKNDNLIFDNLSCSSEDGDLSGRSSPDLVQINEIPRKLTVTCCSLTKIVEFDLAPDYLKHNPYIRRGYRFQLSAKDCIKSLFWWTNETLNIWTHFLGWMLHFYLTLRDHVQIAPEIFGEPALPGMSQTDRFIGTFVSICFQCCTGLSTLYHIFHCRSAESFQCWLGIDLLGISASLLGIFVSSVYYAFWCHPYWMAFYLFMSTLMYAVSMSVQMLPMFLDKKFDKIRTLVFFSWAVSGTIPLCHWAVNNGGFLEPLVLAIIGRIGMMYLLCGVALFFYLTKFPECIFPGKVDFVGSSHQWWHIWIVTAFYHWHNSVIQFISLRMDNGCFEYLLLQ